MATILPFKFDTSARGKNYNNIAKALRCTYSWNKRTNSGAVAATDNGFCICGKAFSAGELVVVQYAKLVGCACCKQLTDGVGSQMVAHPSDVAALKAWAAAMIVALPQMGISDAWTKTLVWEMQGVEVANLSTWTNVAKQHISLSHRIQRALNEKEEQE